LLAERVKGRVDLDGQDRAGQVRQPRRQPARSRADLDGQVVLAQLRGPHQQIEQVQVDEKILPQLALGPDAGLLEQVGRIGKRWRGTGHEFCESNARQPASPEREREAPRSGLVSPVQGIVYPRSPSSSSRSRAPSTAFTVWSMS